MSTDIHVPTLGESISDATIARWIKKAGEAVAADEECSRRHKFTIFALSAPR